MWMFPSVLTPDQIAALAGVPVETTTPLLSVDVGNPAHAVSPVLPGLMFEDINHSGEGGIYAELVQNRSMMASDTTPVHWSTVGGVTLALDTANPLNAALSRSLKVVLPSSTGPEARPASPTTASGAYRCGPEPPTPPGCSPRRRDVSARSRWPSSRRTAGRCTRPPMCPGSAPPFPAALSS
ncbi:hypothetical protein ACQ4WX_03865 [Streptomyces lasalocidi]